MSQENTISSTARPIAVPQYIIISLITILSLGSEYFLNLSYNLSKALILSDLQFDANHIFLPSTLTVVGFALGIPLGPVLTRRYGFKHNFLLTASIFLAGVLLSLFSPDLTVFTIGRTIQGISSGILFFTVLPVSLRSFPNKIRHTFLFMVTIGLFGASAVGALAGSISLSSETWGWIYTLSIASLVISLALCLFAVPADPVEKHERLPVQKWKFAVLALLMVSIAAALCNVYEKGLTSIYVWPFFAAGLLLLLLFLYLDRKGEHPSYVPFHTIKSPKPILGAIMAATSHIALIVAIAGINSFLENALQFSAKDFEFFYVYFFAGITVSAILLTCLYDHIGAGVLGVTGSILVLYTALEWNQIDPGVSTGMLYFQAACLGCGVSMTLISGAIATVFAGNMHEAGLRSATLHSIRNFFAALVTPLIIRFMVVRSGHVSSPLDMYHEVFLMMIGAAVIMIIASLGQVITGKGRGLVVKK